MSDLFSIGSSGVTAYQRALTVVSNNIANVSTDGYSRQNVSLVSNAASQSGAVYLGTGARFESVRRQYDAFVEQNLRNAQADVKAQSPMSTYTNRLIDIMGDQTVGLTSAMNLFFESARNLATDPASLVARGTFMRDADGLAARYRQMSSQMGLIDKETRQALETGVEQVNAYTKQLAYVNRQLAKHNTEAKQPAELLDQRDLLLRRMSELINFNTKFEPNGSVLVSVGDTISRGVLVDGVNSKGFGVIDSPNEKEKLTFIVDPYGTPEPVAGVTSGQLGGLINFREQVLTPSQGFIDELAQTFVALVNEQHHNGLDMDGLVGGDMFQIDASLGAASMQMVLNDSTKIAAAGDFRISDDQLNTGAAQARVSYSPPSYAQPGLLTDQLEPGLSSDYLTPFALSASVPAKAIGAVTPGQGDISVYLDNAQDGQWLEVITRDGRHIAGSGNAAIAPYLMSDGFGMEAGAQYSNETANANYLGMDVFIGARATVTEVQQFDPSTHVPVTPGLASARLVADYATETPLPNFDDYTFTLNGIAMSAPSSSTALVEWVNNKVSDTGVTAALDSDGRLVMSNMVAVVEDGLQYYGSSKSYGVGELTINGQKMGALAATATLSDVVNWVNNSSLKTSDGVQASIDSDGKLLLVNTIPSKVDASTLSNIDAAVRNAAGLVNFSDQFPQGLSIGTYAMPDLGKDRTFQDVVNWVNAQSPQIGGVTATANDAGQFILQKKLGTTDDLSGVFTPLLDANGSEVFIRSDSDIRLGLGASGQPSDLKALGFRTGLHIVGQATDDLIIAVSDSSGQSSIPTVMATYGDTTADAKAILRERQLEIEFTSPTAYKITDKATGDVMAERPFDNTTSASVISFRGLTVTLSSPPKAGDKFLIDGNQDGVGNNEAMLNIVNLETDSSVMGNGLTMTETYIERVNNIGSMARQTNISEQALQVVYQQAIQTRDGVSGVSIDQEAADLVRYQQAYQANAKVMQVGSTLFDAILQVR